MFQRLGLEEALVVHGMDGLDEISIIGPTKLGWLMDESITTKTVMPQDIGLAVAKSNEISGYDAPRSARIMIDILNDTEKKGSARRQMVLANAAAALLVGGKVDDLSSGVSLGNEVIKNGKAYEKLRQLIQYTNGDESKLDRIEALLTYFLDKLILDSENRIERGYYDVNVKVDHDQISLSRGDQELRIIT